MSDEEDSIEERVKPARLWLFILILSVFQAIITVAIISYTAAGQYNPVVHLKDLYLPDPQRNSSHFMALNFPDAQKPSENAGAMMFCQDVGVGTAGDSKEKKRGRWIGKYFFALREDDQWVNMQVHHVVCRQSDSS
jgi:hypothetical protein